MAANAPPQGHANVALKSDMVPQRSSCFVTTGMCHTQDVSSFGSSRSFGVGHNDMYLPTHASHPNQQFQPSHLSQNNQQFQPCSAPLPQRPYQPVAHAQSPSSHFSDVKTTVHSYAQQSFHPNTLPSLPNGRRQYVTDDQWRVHSSDFSSDNQRGVWVAGGRTPCSGTPYLQEGFFRPPIERPPTNPVSFQHPAHNSLAPRASIPGHSVAPMLPCRPSFPHNNWRQA